MLIIGFGRLAQSLVQLMGEEAEIFVYNRTSKKVENFSKYDSRITVVANNYFPKAKEVLLLLPAGEVANFLKRYNQYFSDETVFYNFATALETESLYPLIKNGKIVPCKCLGHAKQMLEDHQGLFVIPKAFELERKRIEKQMNSSCIQFIEGNERDVLYANEEATKAAIKMIIDLKKKLEIAGLSVEMINHSINQTTRGNIKSFQNNDLGGFAKEIIRRLEDD